MSGLYKQAGYKYDNYVAIITKCLPNNYGGIMLNAYAT